MVCPVQIIKIDKDTKYPYISADDELRCIKCGQCSAFCPHNACEIESVGSFEIDTNLLPTVEQTDTLLKSRRSVRMFKKQEIPQEDIQNLLETASNAPSAKNGRPVSWLVLSGRDKLNEAADLAMEYFKEEGDKAASEGDREKAFMYRVMLSVYRKGNDIIFRSAPQLVVALCPQSWDWHEDGAIALTYLEIAAHSRGIGMCWAGYFTVAARNYAPLRELLGISGDDFVCGAQMAGYPLLKSKKYLRRPLQVKFI